MFKKMRLSLLAVCGIMIHQAIQAQSTIEQRKVSFATGKTSSVISSSIKGDKTIDYLVTANQGQVMTITLKGSNLANYFNVLPPGSEDEAIYNSSNGENKFTTTLSASGTYKIRVYLMRSAARRNESSKFTLTVSVTGGNSGDAKVSGTNYNATGSLRAALDKENIGSRSVKFGVIRKGNGIAEVHTGFDTMPKRVFVFQNGKWTCSSADCKIKAAKSATDEWVISVNDYEHYSIPDAVVYGG